MPIAVVSLRTAQLSGGSRCGSFPRPAWADMTAHFGRTFAMNASDELVSLPWWPTCSPPCATTHSCRSRRRALAEDPFELCCDRQHSFWIRLLVNVGAQVRLYCSALLVAEEPLHD